MPVIAYSISVVAILSAFVNILMLTGPLFMLQVYDRVLTSGSFPTLYVLLGLVAVLYGFMSVLDWMRIRLMSRVAHYWDEKLSQDLFKTELANSEHNNAQAPNIASLGDLSKFRRFISGPASFALFDTPWVLIYLAVNFVLHPLLGWFSLCAGLILVTLVVSNRLVTKNQQTETENHESVKHSIQSEMKGHENTIQALALHEGLFNKWKGVHDNSLEAQLSAGDRNSFFSSLTKSFRLFFQAGILALGAGLAIEQQITTGTIIAAAIVLSRGLAPIDQLLANWKLVSESLVSYRRLRTLSSTITAEDKKLSLVAPKGHLAVKKLSSFAPGQPNPILQNINFVLQPGQTMGVIGSSGSGKSTLLNSLLGVWPETKGEVRLDGAEFDQWNREDLSGYLGYVPQDFPLFSGTIAQNISRFAIDATSEDIIEAAQMADVHQMIIQLPLGYNTIVGFRGNRLSAGQRQKISLARAFFRKPRLIVLDEPNSNLDSGGEQALSNSLQLLRKMGSTIIIASHRAFALQNVDKILVLHNGRQVKFDDREKLFNSQNEHQLVAANGS